MARLYTVHRLKIGHTEQMDALARAAGDLYGQVEMGWDGTQYELRATYLLDEPCVIGTQEVAGIDLGEVHLAVAHDGTTTTILNGGYVRSVRRYQNKLKGKRDAYIDRKKKGSARRRRSIQAKQRRLGKVA